MKASDLEDIVSKVSMDLFNYRHPGFSAADNPTSVKSCIDDSAFVISKFISYVDALTEDQVGDD